MRKRLVLLFTVIIVLFNFMGVMAEPELAEQQIPEITATSAILIEPGSGRVLFEKNSNAKMYPASTTKVMTAIIATEYLDKDGVYIVGGEINTVPYDASKSGHIVGEAITGENLLKGLLIKSGNDTANVIAYNVALKYKNVDQMGFDEANTIFVDLMNKKAKELGAENTNFCNPHGYHDENHYTTAKDLSLIFKAASDIKIIREIVSETSFSGMGAGENYDGPYKNQQYTWRTTNLLITPGKYFYEYANGMKTGFTDEAGECLGATAEKDDFKLLSIVLNSKEPDRWTDSKALFEYGFETYKNEIISSKNTIIGEIYIDRPRLGETNLLAAETREDVIYPIKTDEVDMITNKVTYNPNYVSAKKTDLGEQQVITPIKKGEEIGQVEYFLNGTGIGTYPVFASNEVLERTFKSDFDYFLAKSKEIFFSWLIIPITIAFILVGSYIFRVHNIIKRRREAYRFKGGKYKGKKKNSGKRRK